VSGHKENTMRRILALALLFSPAFAHAITQQEMVRHSQQMYDDLAAGNRRAWELYFADDVLYFDEKGHAMEKKALMETITPLPAGYTGSITLKNAKSLIQPTVAILSFDSDETETVYGQEMHARYHETDTWLLRNGKWQIVAGQVLRYYEDPATGTSDPSHLDDFVGTYQITPGKTLVVTRDGDKLFSQRGTDKPVELLPESPDLFFRHNVEGRRLFHRDATGHVDALIDRRNNEDMVWKKIS
jgi:hypothetical protein